MLRQLVDLPTKSVEVPAGSIQVHYAGGGERCLPDKRGQLEYDICTS